MPYLTGDTIPSINRCKVIRIPDDLSFLDALNGQLYELTLPENWEKQGTLTPDQVAAAWSDVYDLYTTQTCVELTDFLYPDSVLLWPPSAKKITGGTLNVASVTGQVPLLTAWYNTSAINDRMQFPLYCRKGTWDFKVHGIQNTASGKVQIFTDENASPITERN